MKKIKKAQAGTKETAAEHDAKAAAFWKGVGKKVGDTKLKDVPGKTVKVVKNVGSKLINSGKLGEAAETTANLVTAGYYGKAKRAMGIKKSGGKMSYKAGGKMKKCKGGC